MGTPHSVGYFLMVLFLFSSTINRMSSAQRNGGKLRMAHRDIDKDLCVPLTENQKQWFQSLGDRDPERESWEPDCLRREYRNLTSSEHRWWYNAVKAMKNNMIDGLSEYDIFVTYHSYSQSQAAHLGAAFLPWHREYLFRFERALKVHDSYTCLPYWDTSLEVGLPVYSDSAVWTPEYFGDSIGTVVSGPFAYWSAMPECQTYGEDLTRNVGAVGKPFEDEDIAYVYSKTEFEQIVCNIDCRLENDHEQGRQFVGGHMMDSDCSATDPIFWLQEAFVDLIWEEFRQDHQLTSPEVEYPVHEEGVKDIGGVAHNPFSEMAPFDNLINIHGLSNHYTDYYYSYSPRSVDCVENEDCGSELIWCDGGRCRAKIMLWGDCTGYPDDACACTGECIPEDDSHTDDPQCINGVCII